MAKAPKSAPKTMKQAEKAFEGSPADDKMDKAGAKAMLAKAKKGKKK